MKKNDSMVTIANMLQVKFRLTEVTFGNEMSIRKPVTYRVVVFIVNVVVWTWPGNTLFSSI